MNIIDPNDLRGTLQDLNNRIGLQEIIRKKMMGEIKLLQSLPEFLKLRPYFAVMEAITSWLHMADTAREFEHLRPWLIQRYQDRVTLIVKGHTPPTHSNN